MTTNVHEGASAQATRIVERLRALGSELREAPPDMQEAICRFATVLKEEHVPRGQIVVMLQTAIARSGAAEITNELRDDVVLKCLEQFDR